MIKKTSLTEALHNASQHPAPQVRESPTPSERSISPGQSRQGKKMIAGHFDVAVAYQIKKLALEQNTTLQKLLTEALNDIIIKYNGKPVA